MERDELFAKGWTVARSSLYDEEGIEGWTWTSPDGEEYDVIGDWSEPTPLPDLAPKPTQPSEETKRFADFLDDLMNDEA